MYAVTAASGRLGRLVVEELLARCDPREVVALVRNPAKVGDLAARGVTVRAFDYDHPQELQPALAGVDRLLLISASEIGCRVRQHQVVIDAAKAATVSFLAYTSVLNAETNPISLAQEHRATEAAIRESGLTYAILRHGWYTENHTVNARMEVDRGTVVGSAGNGRLSTATRADYAAGDAEVLLDARIADQTFELAGDKGFTLSEYATALASVSNRPVTYLDLPEAEYRARLEHAGLPARFAGMLSEASAASAKNVMFDDGHALSRLLGRPTTPMRRTVVEALA